MKPLKFRCFYRNRMYQVSGLTFYEDESMGINGFLGEFFSPDSEHCSPIMQFTGRKDINEIEIFESDIVKSHVPNYGWDEIDNPNVPKYYKEISVVECWTHCFIIKGESYNEDNELWNWDEIEVIGNFYENKELLRGTLTGYQINKI